MEEQKMKAPSGGQKSHGFAINMQKSSLIDYSTINIASTIKKFDISNATCFQKI